MLLKSQACSWGYRSLGKYTPGSNSWGAEVLLSWADRCCIFSRYPGDTVSTGYSEKLGHGRVGYSLEKGLSFLGSIHSVFHCWSQVHSPQATARVLCPSLPSLLVPPYCFSIVFSIACTQSKYIDFLFPSLSPTLFAQKWSLLAV